MRTRPIVAIVAALCFMVGMQAAAQVNSSIGGTVEDVSRALIPGVTVTATNTQTGVTNTSISNEAGTYNFPALIPGTYKLTAELTGFRTAVYNDIELSAATPLRLNFTMEVGGVAQAVEVTVEADTIL